MTTDNNRGLLTYLVATFLVSGIVETAMIAQKKPIEDLGPLLLG